MELYLHSPVHFHGTVTDSTRRELEPVHRERGAVRGVAICGDRYRHVSCVSEVLVMLRGHGEEL